MVINSINKKDISQLSDIAKALSEPGLLIEFSEKIKSFFELKKNITKKNNYNDLIKKKGYSEESPLLYKSIDEIYLYYNLILKRFELYTSWSGVQSRSLVEYYSSVLVGSEVFEDFVKENYDLENPFIVFSEDNKNSSRKKRKDYPTRFEVLDIDKILNLLQKKFESQYKKNLKKFLVDSPESLKFSSTIRDEVFPFFLKASMDYKIYLFSKNYYHFCNDEYKLKDEYLFLKDIHKAFKEWNLNQCYSGRFVFEDVVDNLRKSETDIDKEVSKVITGKFVKEQNGFDSGKLKLENSGLIHDYLNAIETKFRCVGRTNSDYVINWDNVLSVYGNAVSKIILDDQVKNGGYFDIGEPRKNRYSDYSTLSVFTKYLSCDYAKGKTYKFDPFYLVNKNPDLFEIKEQLDSLSKIIDNETNIEFTMFHSDYKMTGGIYTLLSNEDKSKVLFKYLFDLPKNKKKFIIFRKPEIEIIKGMVAIGILQTPIDNFFERLEEFTLI